MTTTPEVTARLADYLLAARPTDLPDAVRREARRAFLNILGCTLGGARHEAVDCAEAALGEFAGAGQATLLGRGRRADPLHACLINCFASSIYSFDDTHETAIVHPSGPVFAAVLAVAERQRVTGADALLAFALGVEIVCRLSMAISVPPARGTIAWSQTGVASGVGAALAAGKLLGLDAVGLRRAIGIAASQAAGFRAMHGTMTTSFMPAHAAQTGLRAAFLAAKGFTASLTGLEGRYGFLSVFAEVPDIAALIDDLGERFELLRNTYKPYPCGIVIHPILDACLQLRAQHALDHRQIERVEIKVSPAGMALCDRRDAQDEFQAHVSLYHWTAIALIRGTTLTTDMQLASVRDPEIVAFQPRITAIGDPSIAPDQTELRITMRDGTRHDCRIEHCLGSATQPMTDAQLEAKFRGLAEPVVGTARTASLIAACWDLEQLADAAAIARDAA
jgi:2-methylcitrate dehydratase PrpD